MSSLRSLQQQLKDLLILNHGDIKITEYPHVVSDARELNLNLGQLNQLIQQVYSEIDWKPYQLINEKLETIFRKGIISVEQFDEIAGLVSEKINRNVVEEYVISEISKRGFKPRESNDPNPLSIHNVWMTDLIWEEYKESIVEVEWLGERARSVAKLGEISFRNKEEAKYFLRNGNYLPGLITALSKSASKADQFARIIENEFDPEKRYLRIIYRLNPRLQFRFKGKLYTEIAELLREACSNPNLYNALIESYGKGEIQIWIQESHPSVAVNLSAQNDVNSFLRFLYKTDSTLPFILNGRSYSTPQDLMDQAKTDFGIWQVIAESIAEGNLNEWFAGTGREDWNIQLKNSRNFIQHAGYYSDEEINLGIVQALFHIVDPLSEKPKLTIDQDKIQLLSVDGGALLNHRIQIGLKNQGYIRVKVYFKFAKEGISLQENIFEFNNLEGKVKRNINIVIDTLLLKRDHLYNLELVVSSVYEDIVIPLEIKVVFPRKAYITKLGVYGLITACYFGLFRYLLGISLNYTGWLVAEPSIGNTGGFIGNSPLLSFALFALFIVGAIFSFKLVKKVENI